MFNDAYFEHKASALEAFKDKSKDWLLQRQAVLRDLYRREGPKHSLVAQLEVIRDILNQTDKEG